MDAKVQPTIAVIIIALAIISGIILGAGVYKYISGDVEQEVPIVRPASDSDKLIKV